MAKQGSIQVGDRVKVTFPGHAFYGQFGNVSSRSQEGHDDIVLVDFDSGTKSNPVFESHVTKVPQKAGRPPFDSSSISSNDRLYMFASLGLVLLRENPDPQEFTAKLYNTADELGLL